MKIRLALLLTVCLAACAGASTPALPPVSDTPSSEATPTAAPKQLLFIEFFAIH